MLQFLAALAVGATVGYILYKLKVPGGMMVGAIVGTACLTLATGFSYMPYTAKQAAQITAGTFIGCSVKREELSRLRYIYKPSAAMMGAMLALNLLVGFAIYAITPLDMLTSLLCAVPGGISEVPLIATDLGADATKVAVMQFVRMVVGVGFFPTFITWVTGKEELVSQTVTTESNYPADSGSAPQMKETSKENRGLASRLTVLNPLFMAVICGAVCGILGLLSHIPSGTLLLPMLGIICLKLLRVPVCLPREVRRAAQVLAGSYIGCSVTFQDLLDIKQLAIPVVILLTGYLLNSYLSGRMLSRFFGLTLKQGMLAASPAGASDIALISADMGAQSADVVILQVLRMLMAVSVFPYILRFIVNVLGG